MRVFVILAVAVAVAIGLATAISPFASSRPDGLERVATDHAGFTGTALAFGAAALARRRPVLA